MILHVEESKGSPWESETGNSYIQYVKGTCTIGMTLLIYSYGENWQIEWFDSVSFSSQ